MFFAPSAAISVIPALSEFFAFERHCAKNANEDLPEGRFLARVAVIGPTTRDALRNELGLAVHAMAERPTADHLVTAILEHDGGSINNL